MTLEQIGILLSLVITIFGWGVTAYYQRRILERQIASEREKEVRQLLIPRKIEQLETIRNWVEAGYRLWNEWKKRPIRDYMSLEKLKAQRDDLDNRIANWASIEFTPIEILIDIIEPFETQEDDSLGDMLAELISAMPTGNPNYYDEHPDFESKSGIVIDTYYPKAIQKIDELIGRVIKEQYQNR